MYEQIGQMNTKIAGQTTEFEHLKSVTSNLEVQIETNKSENETLKALNKDLKDTIKQREVKMNYHGKELNILEQFTRRNSLRIYGMHDQNKFETTEQTSELVSSMSKNKLDVTVHMSDIDIAHRLGTFRLDGNRLIICKFASRETKLRILRARRLLKGSSVVVREDLTIKTAKLLEVHGQRPEVKNAWSDEGRKIALLHSGRKIRVDINTNLYSTLTSLNSTCLCLPTLHRHRGLCKTVKPIGPIYT